MTGTTNWRYAASSVTGTAHASAERGCDDAWSCEIVQSDEGRQYLIAAVADGAGSSELGAIGSQIACKSIVDQAQDWLKMHSNLRAITETTAHEWLDGVKESIANEAGELGLELRDLATTLLFAIVGEDEAFFSQVGDGAIVVLDAENEWSWASWPQHGAFASETYFVTDPGAHNMICSSMARRPIREIALFTDGLERLLLNHAEKTVQSAAFDKMFKPLRASGESGEDTTLSKSLNAYLSSPAVASRSDDDITLIIASRSKPELDQ